MAPATCCLIGDTGQDANRLRVEPLMRGVRPVTPANPVRNALVQLGRELYPLRKRVERLVNRLKPFRAVAARYATMVASYLPVVHLPATRI